MLHSASPSRPSIKLDEATEQLQIKLLLASLGRPFASMVSSQMATRSWSAYQAGKKVMLCSTYCWSSNGVLRFTSIFCRGKLGSKAAQVSCPCTSRLSLTYCNAISFRGTGYLLNRQAVHP